MKTNKEKYISISDLADEFHVSKASIELYGVHRLLPPLSNKANRPIYRPLDKVRLQFISRAKNADYTIGNIKNLIGVLDFEKEESDQIEDNLVYGKKKYEELKSSLESLDVLEQINITCDLELLEGYIKDLNNLKYGLHDLPSLNISTPDAEIETNRAKPNIALSSVRINSKFVDIKTLLKPLLVGIGILMITVFLYIYLEDNPIFKTTDNLALPIDTETAESNPTTSISVESEEALLSSLDFQALKNELQAEDTNLADDSANIALDEQMDDAQSTAELSDIIQESQKTKTEKSDSDKEDTEDTLFKQLVADLENKYEKQTKAQTTKTGEVKNEMSTPKKKSKAKDNKSLSIATTSGTAPMTNKTSADKQVTTPAANINDKKARKEPKAKQKTPKKITSLKAATQTPSKKVVTSVVTQVSPNLNSGNKSMDAGSKLPPVVSPKTATSTVPPKPRPRPPQKPANPEALKWVQKSYESVMSGDAGEAIITASVALTLDPNLVNAYINRSWAYSKKGLFDKAIQDCDKALDIDTNNALAYNNRGLAFQGKGDMGKAKADYERACKLGFDIGCKNYQEVVGVMADNS